MSRRAYGPNWRLAFSAPNETLRSLRVLSRPADYHPANGRLKTILMLTLSRTMSDLLNRTSRYGEFHYCAVL